MEKKIRVAFYIPLLNIGGAERVVLDVSEALSCDSKYEVFLVCDSERSTLQFQVGANVKVVNFPDTSKGGLLAKVIRLAKVVNRCKFDVVFSNLTHANIHCLSSRLVLGWRHARLVLVEHSILSQYLRSRRTAKHYVLSLCVRMMYPFAQHFICVSRATREDIIRFCDLKPNKLTVIANPIYASKIAYKRVGPIDSDTAAFVAGHKTIVCIGRLEPQKNQILLLEAMKDLCRYDYRLIVIGGGSQMARLQAYCQDNELEYAVRFLGYQENPYKYLECADILVLPSLFEGFGIVLVEGLYLGKQVVATNLPTAQEILEDGRFGKLVEWDAAALAKGIRAVSADPIAPDVLRMRALQFDLRAIVDEYKRYIESLVNR